MHELLKKNCDPGVVGYMSQWTGSESFVDQSSLSHNLSLKMGSSTPLHRDTKQLSLQFPFQDQDSSSTQSTCQSYPEVASAGNSYQYGENKFSIQSVHGTHEDSSVGSPLLMGTREFAITSQAVHSRQPCACIPLLYPDPYCHGLLSPYGSQTMLPHLQGISMPCTRVPLPLDYAHDEPVYVNVKQYNAILRRRQYRAKLEAQNKLSKPRKPYLHESRHVHAVKRARGPGGRFLNLNKLQETQPDGLINKQDDLCHQNKDLAGGGATCSDISSVSNGDNFFHQQEHRFSIYNSHVDGPTQAGRTENGAYARWDPPNVSMMK